MQVLDREFQFFKQREKFGQLGVMFGFTEIVVDGVI